MNTQLFCIADQRPPRWQATPAREAPSACRHRYRSTLVAALCATALAGPPAVANEEQAFSSGDLFNASLSGDWSGWRTTLAEHGVFIDIANTTDLFANLDGGVKQATSLSNLVEASVLLDLQTLAGLKGGTFYMLAVGTHGEDPAELTGTVHAPSNLAADDAFRLMEFWYEQALWHQRLGLLLGLYAVDSEFDAKETADVFVNGGFGTGLDLSETGLNGPSIFPTTSLGMRLRADLGSQFTFRLAVVDGVPGDPDEPEATEVHLRDGDGLLFLGEINYQPSDFDFLRLGLGSWRYTTDFEDLVDTTAGGDPVIRDDSWGVYGFAEGIIFNEAGDHEQGLSGFIRLGYADEDVNQFENYYGAGLVYTGLLPGRDDDVLGLGISTGVNGDKFKTAQRLAGSPVTDSETVVELTYHAQVLPWLSLQPVLQYSFDPGTDPQLDNSLAAGLRLGIGL